MRLRFRARDRRSGYPRGGSDPWGICPFQFTIAEVFPGMKTAPGMEEADIPGEVVIRGWSCRERERYVSHDANGLRRHG